MNATFRAYLLALALFAHGVSDPNVLSLTAGTFWAVVAVAETGMWMAER